MQNCIFCKIIAGEIPAEIIDQNEHIVVIKDIAPKAPVHYLIIPKRHIRDVSRLKAADGVVAVSMFQMAQRLSDLHPGEAFRLVMNNGSGVGQSVFHLHCHFLSGKSMTDL